MCGPPCQDCSGHVYSHGPEKHNLICLNCFVKRFPNKKDKFEHDHKGNWVWKEGPREKSDFYDKLFQDGVSR